MVSLCACQLLTNADNTNEKTEYYFGYFNNARNGNLSVIIMTTKSQPVGYLFETNDNRRNGTVVNNEEFNVTLPESLRIMGTGSNRGIYLVIYTDKATVIGQNLGANSSDTFLFLPIANLCVAEYVYYGMSVPSGASRSNSFMTIVATEANTSLIVLSRKSFNITIRGNITNFVPGLPRSFEIDRFQTGFIRMVGDLTGTKVVTNKPVSVSSGHQCARIPTNSRSCDHLIEQVPPTALWGRVYYTAPLATRRLYTIKVLAAYNVTVVNICCNNTMMTKNISEGESFNITQSRQEYCTISSNRKVLVVQLSHNGNGDDCGDPMMTLIPATNQYSNTFQFSTLQGQSGYTHHINIIVLTRHNKSEMVYLLSQGVNRSLDTHQWVPITINNDTEAIGVQVNVSEGVAEIVHVNTSAMMSAIVYGFTKNSGYGHPVGNYRLKGQYFIYLNIMY